MAISQIMFTGQGVDALRAVLEAFIAPFPSLKGLDEATQELLKAATTGRASPDDLAKISEIVDQASWDGEWPAHVYTREERVETLAGYHAGNGPFSSKELVVQPYCGDRVLRLSAKKYPEDANWRGITEFSVTADYSRRPSNFAAAGVRALVWDEAMIRQSDELWIASTLQTTHWPEKGKKRHPAIIRPEGELVCSSVHFVHRVEYDPLRGKAQDLGPELNTQRDAEFQQIRSEHAAGWAGLHPTLPLAGFGQYIKEEDRQAWFAAVRTHIEKWERLAAETLRPE